MNLMQFFEIVLFNIGSLEITLGHALLATFFLILLVFLYRLTFRRFLANYFRNEEIGPPEQRKVRFLLRICFALLALLAIMMSLRLDPIVFTHEQITIKASTVLGAILALQIARLLDWMISRLLVHNYQKRHNDQAKGLATYERRKERIANKTVQYAVYVLAVILVFQSLGIDYEYPATVPGSENKPFFQFRLSKFFIALLILLSARLAIWILVQLVLFSYYRRKRTNVGAQYAINQLLTYFVYVIAILTALEALGVKLTVIWGGAAALLVGIGLGLQQTFNDLISGLILLFERTVEVGDVVDVSGLVGTVKKIGLRTSLVETRDNITVIVPNSKLIVDNVVNWSHYDNKARFNVEVGVAYGSDTALVKELLLQTAKENGFVLKYPAPFVRFTNFGSSSLDFQLHFWSQEFIKIEDVKSDLRFEIDRNFRAHDIQIPFPQRDIWIKQGAPPAKPDDQNEETT